MFAERGMRGGVERINFDLLAEGSGGFVVLVLPLERQAEIVVRVLVRGVDFELLTERRGGVVELSGAQIGEAEVVPRLLVMRIELDGAIEERNGRAGITCIQQREAGFDQIVGRADEGTAGSPGDVVVTTSARF